VSKDGLREDCQPTPGSARRLLAWRRPVAICDDGWIDLMPPWAACFDLVTGSDQISRSSPSCLLGLALVPVLSIPYLRGPRSNTSELPFVLPIHRPRGLVHSPPSNLPAFSLSGTPSPPIPSLLRSHVLPFALLFRSLRLSPASSVRSPPGPLALPVHSPSQSTRPPSPLALPVHSPSRSTRPPDPFASRSACPPPRVMQIHLPSDPLTLRVFARSAGPS
jgi:hypothetical protein